MYHIVIATGATIGTLQRTSELDFQLASESMAAPIMASIRNGGGVFLCVGLQVLGYRCLLIALLLQVMSIIVGVHGAIVTDAPQVAPTPTQPRQDNLIYNQYEADALNAVLQNWTKLNPQLSTVLKWSPDRHPCNTSDLDYLNPNYEFEGGWRGVFCTPVAVQESNSYEVTVTSLMLIGSKMSCAYQAYFTYYNLCGYEGGFEGIKGELPSEISKLINLEYLAICYTPELTGPVPVEIWQMPKLAYLDLSVNSLVGTLPTNALNSSFYYINVSFNHLDGPVDFQGQYMECLDLHNNHFNGTFSTGPYFDPSDLQLSNNDFTNIKFANYTGQNFVSGQLTQSNGPGTVYMPSLLNFKASNNKLSGAFPMEFLRMPSLEHLNLSRNNLSGSVNFSAMENSWITSLRILDLSKNHFSGLVDFRGIDTISSLMTLNINNNNFNGTFFSGVYLNPNELDLSNNFFNNISFDIYNGTIVPVNNEYMPLLKHLYIQNNKLNGEFPAYILKAPNLQNLYGYQNQYETLQLPDIPFENSTLLMVSLTNNCINDIQYPNNPGHFSTSNLQVSNLLFLGGNPICNKIESVLLSTICRQNQSSSILSVAPKFDSENKVIIATSISSIFAFVLLLALYIWRLISRIKSLNTILKEFEKKEVKPNLYSYREIKLATKNFDKKNKLGEGGFGIVYKGELFDGTIVAVKKLTLSSGQVLSEFLNEVVVIYGLKHRNLVKLKGCCLGDGEQRMLIFEYVENKNLAEALWMQDNSKDNFELPYLNWTTRYDIIVGIARGLAYLHEDLQSPVIHRDIKASNILLDKNYEPKIADFGLAYLFPILDNEASHLTMMQVVGTRGYCSPEYAFQGHVSTALDVYSFGIVVLEILSGRKNIDLQKIEEEVYLREWAWKQYQAKASMTLIDSKMKQSSTDLEAITRVISVALSCVHYKAAMRPKMNDVVPMLLGNMPISDFCKDFEYGEQIW